MSAVKEVFSILAARAEEAIHVHDSDYLGEDGLLICGKCHTPKQCRPFPDSDFAVYCLCQCHQEEDRLMQERLRSGMPCVITTNLSMNDFAVPKDLAMKRIVSRMFERSTTFQVKDEDRRFAALKARAVRTE